jgi:hypothetical protein
VEEENHKTGEGSSKFQEERTKLPIDSNYLEENLDRLAMILIKAIPPDKLDEIISEIRERNDQSE